MASDGVTNWKAVSPDNRKKVAPLVRHYMKQAHPFTACVNDNTKRFGPERAKRICAVVKDMGKRTTNWRNGKGLRESAFDADAYVAEAFDAEWAPVLDAEGVTVDELAAWSKMAADAGLVEAPLSMTVGLGDLSLLEATRAGGGGTTAGEKLSQRGRTAQATGKREKDKPRTRGGGDADFEKKHPRSRGGTWTIKQGAKGDDVRTVQRRIGAKADGQFGAMTKDAVMAFQRKHGLQVDGVVGHQTAVALAGNVEGAKTAKVGALKGSDRAKLAAMRKDSPGPSKGKGRSEDDPNFNWRTDGNGKRGVILKDGSRKVVTGAEFDRLRRAGKLSSKTPKLKGDGRLRETPTTGALAMKVDVGAVRETPATGALGLRIGEDLRLVESEDANAIHEEADLALVETTNGHGTLQDLSLIESTRSDAVQFNDDGTVDFVIIRPCHGRGIANAIYESAMLERDAHVFAGWPVYDNHESPAAAAARRGIPRPPSELAGEIRESFWDPDFTTPEDSKFGFERGAVIGRFMLTEDMEKLVRRLPRAVKTSVNAQATGKKPVRRNGKVGMLVEGIVNDPENCSVDLVTKAGAGGQVASLYRQLAVAA